MTSRTSLPLVLACACGLLGLPLHAAAQPVAPEPTPDVAAPPADEAGAGSSTTATEAVDEAAPRTAPLPDEAAVQMTDAVVDTTVEEPDSDEPSSFVNFLQQNVAIHGFGTWGMGITGTPDGHVYGFNQYQYGQHKGDFSQTQFALREIVQATPEIRLAAGQSFRASADNGIFLELDLANAEWTPTPGFSIRAGRTLTPLGFYTENYRVGTLRPFAVLPQSVYGPGGILAQYYDGLGATFRWRTESDWQVRLELFAGHMFVPVDSSIIVVLDGLVGNPYRPSFYGNSGTDLAFMGGGTLWVETPVEGLVLMAGGFAAPAKMVDRNSPDHASGLVPWTGNLAAVAGIAYVTDRLEIRSEMGYRNNFYQHSLNYLGTAIGGYLEVAYRILEPLQVALRGELVRGRIDQGFVPLGSWDTILYHQDVGFSLNYWWNRDLVVKLAYHYVHGNRFAHPNNQDMYSAVTSSIAALDFTAHFQQSTHYAALVTSFSF